MNNPIRVAPREWGTYTYVSTVGVGASPQPQPFPLEVLKHAVIGSVDVCICYAPGGAKTPSKTAIVAALPHAPLVVSASLFSTLPPLSALARQQTQEARPTSVFPRTKTQHLCLVLLCSRVSQA
jgi:hypothetical protein